MLLGIAAGLYGYFAVGFYVAALVGAAASMAAVLVAALLSRSRFEWAALREERPLSPGGIA
jgi:hypothetical protein